MSNNTAILDDAKLKVDRCMTWLFLISVTVVKFVVTVFKWVFLFTCIYSCLFEFPYFRISMVNQCQKKIKVGIILQKGFQLIVVNIFQLRWALVPRFTSAIFKNFIACSIFPQSPTSVVLTDRKRTAQILRAKTLRVPRQS